MKTKPLQSHGRTRTLTDRPGPSGKVPVGPCSSVGAGLALALLAGAAQAQSSSLFLGRANDRVPSTQPASDEPRRSVPPEPAVRMIAGASQAHAAVEQTSLIAVEVPEPKKYKVHDLVTIIVREQKKFESDGEAEQTKKLSLDARLEEWFRLYAGCKLGADQLRYGEPSVKLGLDGKYSGEGSVEREDKFTTRITAEVIDVKPNGNLVLQARTSFRSDNEDYTMTLTGTCRSVDVNIDNTVLSTQVHDLDIAVSHKGLVRDAMRRGWLHRLVDWMRLY